MKLKIGILLLAAILLVGCASEAPESSAPPKTGNESAAQQSNSGGGGGAAPGQKETYELNFTAKTIDGQEFSSEQFSESKVTMINVWATYCNPCLAEMPDLGEIAQSYDKSEFQLIGIISDVVENAPQSDIDNAEELIQQTEADYPHLLLSQSLFDNLVGGVSSVPTTFFVNSKGEMLGYVVGANDEDTWEKIIDDLLAKEGVIDD